MCLRSVSLCIYGHRGGGGGGGGGEGGGEKGREVERGGGREKYKILSYSNLKEFSLYPGAPKL